MNPMTDWGELFLSAQGRVGQLPFTVASAILLFVLGLFQAAVGGPLQLMTGIIVYPLLFFCGACVLSKRLHDRGRSGWWAAVILLAIVIVWPVPVGFFDFVGGVVLLWAVVDLCIMPGERGDNRYGRTLFRQTVRD